MKNDPQWDKRIKTMRSQSGYDHGRVTNKGYGNALQWTMTVLFTLCLISLAYKCVSQLPNGFAEAAAACSTKPN